MIGEHLYQLSASDELGNPLIQRYATRTIVSGLVTPIVCGAPVIPQDQALLLDYFQIDWIAGGAQTITLAELVVFADGSLDERTGDLVEIRSPGGQNLSDRRRVGSIIMPGEQIVGIGTFSGAVAANQVTMSLWGKLIPRGNLFK